MTTVPCSPCSSCSSCGARILRDSGADNKFIIYGACSGLRDHAVREQAEDWGKKLPETRGCEDSLRLAMLALQLWVKTGLYAMDVTMNVVVREVLRRIAELNKDSLENNRRVHARAARR